MKHIITIKGLIKPAKVTGVYAHEHLALNLFKVRQDKNAIIDDPILVAKELATIKKYKVNLIVDLSNIVMGRNVDQLLKISNLTNMHIIAATGFYLDPYLKDYQDLSAQKLSAIMIKEIEQGIGKNKIKPGIIGEIAASEKITALELKSFQAAAIASKKTNLPIYTHTSFGKMGYEIAKLLIDYEIAPTKITIGHLDLTNDLTTIEKILKLGVFIGFDTIGKNEYNTNENRINNLIYLIKKGYENQILISQDLTKQSHFKANGGYGFDYIFTDFLPAVQKVIAPKIIYKLLVTNPVKFLSLKLNQNAQMEDKNE